MSGANVRVKVGQVKAKRITGWGITCSVHGEGDKAFRSKKTAIMRASEHAESAHPGRAVVVHP